MAATIAWLIPFLLSIVSDAHTWIDCIDTDRSKVYDQSALYIFGGIDGNGLCQGYGAGYPGRGNGDIGLQYTYKMLRNDVQAGTPVCKNVGSNTYSDWRKRISLAPGQTAYFGYLPNGHIVKDKKAVGTQHGVYWTGHVGTSLSSTLDMVPGNLLNGHTMNYDDGNCGETVDRNGIPSNRAGDGKPCIGTFTIPAGTAPGIYNMVWYWTFWLDNEAAYVDHKQAKGYFGAAYSTCFEVEVIPAGGVAAQTTPAPATTPATAVTPAPAPGQVIPAPVDQINALPAPLMVGAAAPNLTSASSTMTFGHGTVVPGPAANSDGKNLLPSKDSLEDATTVHPAKQSSSEFSNVSSSADSGSGVGKVGQVGQEKRSTPSTAASPATASKTTQSSAANYIKASEGRLVLGVALLMGALV
ncbi:unnamed protein product [Peronospora belbahrii]|uniref:DUF7492 domain-containing protein n=1 Tax=Peronospora belbahrii TaxID=622444 RepID=A0ABN8CYU1_9STRA|nr:unnamed protein product [Peronospora belbahrii]